MDGTAGLAARMALCRIARIELLNQWTRGYPRVPKRRNRVSAVRVHWKRNLWDYQKYNCRSCRGQSGRHPNLLVPLADVSSKRNDRTFVIRRGFEGESSWDNPASAPVTKAADAGTSVGDHPYHWETL